MNEIISPRDFYSERPPERIIGSECEYKLQPFYTPEGSTRTIHLDTDKYTEKVYEVIEGYGVESYGEFLTNGARLYNDAGEHIEYCTPESLGPRQAAAADLAGMALLKLAFSDEGMMKHSGLFRTSGTNINRYMANSTHGYHENYVIPRSLLSEYRIEEHALKIIPSFLASRTWGMAGHVGTSGFSLSQKTSGIGGDSLIKMRLHMSTEGHKPMVTIPLFNQDRDIFDDEQWARMEVRFGDPGFSRAMRYLGFAGTSLVLRMVEHAGLYGNDHLANLQFKNPVRAAAIFSNDLSLRAYDETVTGKYYSATDMTEAFLEDVLWLSERIELPESELGALPLWQKSVDALRQCNISEGEYGTAPKLFDFAARHQFLARRYPNMILDNRTPEIIYDHLSWDRLSPQGIGELWWSRQPQPWIDPAEVKALITHAPAETRAATRADLIRRRRFSANPFYNINWSKVFDQKKKATSIGAMYQ